MRGIEPPFFAWEAKTLPLSYIRVIPFPGYIVYRHPRLAFLQ